MPVSADTSYPFEFSVYPWAMNQSMRFTLQLVDNGVTNTSTPITLVGTTATPPTAYDDWKTAQGLPVNALDSSDSDGDGWRNLLEYALNLNPQVADTNFALNYSTDGATVKIIYTKWRSDVTYFVESSLDLITWTRAGVTEIQNGATVTASVPIDATQSRFLRLGVSYP